MKTRCNFVSNSSSTSFVIAYKEPNSNIQAFIDYVNNPPPEAYSYDNGYELGTDRHVYIKSEIETYYDMYTKAIAGKPDQKYTDDSGWEYRQTNEEIADQNKKYIEQLWEELQTMKRLSEEGHSFIELSVGYHDEALQGLYQVISDDPTTVRVYCDH